jgi:hypothetical protein
LLADAVDAGKLQKRIQKLERELHAFSGIADAVKTIMAPAPEVTP